ncbi:MAG TPA: nuclear transport factor 2 family protein [Stenotrophomonas sp.]|nr:nuclear transport factor 2 family protein [Stenotrophomonas sp.]
MTDSDPFTAFLSGYAAAVRARDVTAFLSLYDPSLHVFDMWQTAPLAGLPAWRAMAEGWFGGLGDEVVVVTWRQAQSQVSGDLASGQAILNFAAQAPDGSVLRALDNRLSVTLRRGPDGWKVVHEHTSAPIEHGTMAAVLKLP